MLMEIHSRPLVANQFDTHRPWVKSIFSICTLQRMEQGLWRWNPKGLFMWAFKILPRTLLVHASKDEARLVEAEAHGFLQDFWESMGHFHTICP